MYTWHEAYMLARERIRDRWRRAQAEPRDARKSGHLTLVPGISRGDGGVRATLILCRGEVLALQTRGAPYRVTCVAGRLWATEERRPVDHLLRTGEQVTLAAGGRVVIQSLGIATLRLDCPRPARVALGAALQPVAQPG